ncbi:MAG: hypothetical protein Q4B70_11530 [Lachnospiraceae bacterium]|nr:hypothetical protein [Lachnospiraceae bacterium]
MYTYVYQFANTTIGIQIPFPVTQQKRYRQFLLSENNGSIDTLRTKPDIDVTFISCENEIIHREKPMLAENARVFKSERGFYLELSQGKEASITSIEQLTGTKQTSYICKYYEKTKWELYYSNFLIEAISLEHILNREQIFILHSSYIRWRKKSILFTAPSGTGKSTQAQLWNKYEKVDIINGDRTAIGTKEDNFYSYGIPFCGSSDISKNVTCPLGAVVVLRQAKNNSIVRLTDLEAFKYIYSETIVHSWDPEYVEICMEKIEKLVKSVPVYLLFCRPDREAVEVLKNELEQIW